MDDSTLAKQYSSVGRLYFLGIHVFPILSPPPSPYNFCNFYNL